MQENKIILLGNGITNRAIAEKFAPCVIFDDKCGTNQNSSLPSISHLEPPTCHSERSEESNKNSQKDSIKSTENSAQKDSFGNLIFHSSKLPEFLEKNKNAIVITSPGIPPQNAMITECERILGHLPLSEYDFIFSQILKEKLPLPRQIWISGTNGKTTTTQMCEFFLNKAAQCGTNQSGENQSKTNQSGEPFCAAGGNIGTPLALLDKTLKAWVLETSSFTLHYTKTATPDIYLLLPLSEDHISWHGDFSAYVRDKLSPLMRMNSDCVAILPRELKEHELCAKSAAKLVFYENAEDLIKQVLCVDSIESSCEQILAQIPFKEPFLLDCVLALCAAKITLNIVPLGSCAEFKIGAHRIEEFRDSKNRLWVDDSKGTNIDATMAALRRYKADKILLILGGDDKGADLSPLFELMANLDVEVFSIGTNALKIAALCEKINKPCEVCEILQNAVKSIKTRWDLIESEWLKSKYSSTIQNKAKSIKESENFEAKNLSQKKQILGLLSPAAASLDQFKSYAERGNLFKKFALEL